MKKILGVGLFVGIMAVTSVYAAIQVEVVGTGGNYANYGPYQTGVGGEFTFQSLGWNPTTSYAGSTMNQAAGAAIQPNFQSFCVEGREFIYPYPSTYDVVLNTKSEWSGVSLTAGAAWLYSQFSQGKLDNYNYTGGYSSSGGTTARAGGNNSSAALLQNALWYFMGGQEGQTYTTSNPFETLAVQQLGSLDAANAVAGANNFGVMVMNLWAPGTAIDPTTLNPVNTQTTGYQDMLVYVPNMNVSGGQPVPDGGTTAIMLGLGLSCLGLIRHRLGRN
jgi:hypothetical protein